MRAVRSAISLPPSGRSSDTARIPGFDPSAGSEGASVRCAALVQRAGSAGSAASHQLDWLAPQARPDVPVPDHDAHLWNADFIQVWAAGCQGLEQ